MATQMTKSQLIEQIATATELSKKDVKGVAKNNSNYSLQLLDVSPTYGSHTPLPQ